MNRTKTQKLLYYTSEGFFKKALTDLMEVEERVAYILKNYPEARNSDTFLVLKYWQQIEGRHSIILNDGEIPYYCGILTSPETIRRTRQKLQEMGLFPAELETKEVRTIREDAFKTWALNRRVQG